MITRLTLIGLFVTGCVTYQVAAPSAAPTPLVIYVTPAPTARPTPTPTPDPTLAPTPVPTPEPTLAGTDWLTFLAWAIGPASDLSDLIDRGSRSGLSLSDYAQLGREGRTLSNDAIDWLMTHDPQPCWQNVWDAEYDQWDASLTAWSAMADHRFEAAIAALPEMNRLLDRVTATLKLQTC